MIRGLFAVVALLALSTATASAQRCPAGQDQFLNCYPMTGATRAKHEQWANQPAARRIPGAQAAPNGQPMDPCVYQKAMTYGAAGDPRMVRLRAANAKIGGTAASANTLRNTRDYRSLQHELRAACGR
jgi:hypothetical protein